MKMTWYTINGQRLNRNTFLFFQILSQIPRFPPSLGSPKVIGLLKKNLTKIWGTNPPLLTSILLLLAEFSAFALFLKKRLQFILLKRKIIPRPINRIKFKKKTCRTNHKQLYKII
jgi:hypothetical protein